MNVRSILLFCLLFFHSASGDSLDTLLLNQKIVSLETAVGHQKIELYGEIAWLMRVTKNQEARVFADQGMQLALELKDSVNYFDIKAKLGIIQAIQSEFNESISNLNDALAYFKKK